MIQEVMMRFDELAQSAEGDEFHKWELDDTRRPKMTLEHLNKMRAMREMAKAEHVEQVKNYKQMYAANTGGGE